MSEFGFLVDISIIILSFIVCYKFKIHISNFLLKIKSPIFLLALLTSIPFIFIEESINCIDHGDGLGCRMTMWINIILLIEISILLFIIKKKKVLSIKKPLIYFGLIGLIWEIVAGGLFGWMFHPFILFMGPYVMLSYAYIALIPVTMMTLYNKKNQNL